MLAADHPCGFPARSPGMVLALALIGALGAGRGSRAAGPVMFESAAGPVLRAKCVRCHGGGRVKAGLDLRTADTIRKGGDSGPAIEPGKPDDSLLLQKVVAREMPPGKSPKLTPGEIAALGTWIAAGGHAAAPANPAVIERRVTAADRRFWAFHPPVRPAVPPVKAAARVRTPIDAFILAALERHGLTLAPEADRRTLIRRATFDLTGLPPTPAEIDAFLADPRPDAYERLIDRLLASPCYGERWGRHWLDVAGYADSEGYLDEDLVRPTMWRYRDYVIRGFNADKPYDRFVQEQLAGDELVDYRAVPALTPEVVSALEATGYLRTASDPSRDDFVKLPDTAPGYYYQTVHDTVQIIGSSLLGLTLHCCRCHDHKYDPLLQRDYYRVQGILMAGFRPDRVKTWVPSARRRIVAATAAEQRRAAAHNAVIDAAVAAIRKQLDTLAAAHRKTLFDRRLAALPAAIRDDVRTALATPAARRNDVQKYLASKFAGELQPPPAELARLDPEYARQAEALQARIRAEEARRTRLPEIRGFYDLDASPPPNRLLRRGDWHTPGAAVPPGVPAVLTDGTTPSVFPPPRPGARTTGWRTAFARWLTRPDHPLLARVMVNRIWMHHFGEGIVATPDNFGHAGSRPTHPELLDWLATEFVRQGWSIKAMHRLMMTSSVYRQGSRRSAAAAAIDPDDTLWWRMRARRLDAESIRDSVLAVAGSLDPRMFGPPVPVQRRPDGEVVADSGRRSVYLLVRRSQPLSLLQSFDSPVMETNCPRRFTSTVVSQAFMLLNSDFIETQAGRLAERVCRDAAAGPSRCATDPAARVEAAYRLALGRRPTSEERAMVVRFLHDQAGRYGAAAGPQRQALADLCKVLLNSNEFLYID